MISNFRFRRTVRAKFPALRLDPSLLKEIAKLGEASILSNIRRQQQADGAALKANAPQTRERKRKKRRLQLSLVDSKHRFVRGKSGSWTAQIHARTSTVILQAATNELRNLSEYVQRMGYVGWLGINKQARAAMRASLRKWIVAKFRGARR